MTRIKGGFTLVEVSLFLAITGLLFLGVTIGVQNSIFQQRYNDSVQNFAEFLRSAYAKTENVQGSIGAGNTDKAIYGKLITFGEENSGNTVYMYSVVGKARCGEGFNGTLDALSSCKADVLKDDGKPYMVESYTPKWSAAIQDVDWQLFKGAVLITRHPQSGTVYTFVMAGKTINVNNGGRLDLKNNIFYPNEVNFCVNPNGDTKAENGGNRADVKIVRGARNSSGIETLFDEGNECMGRG